MKETVHYAFRIVNDTLIVEFLDPEDEETHDYVVAPTNSLGQIVSEEGPHKLSLLILHLEEKSWVPLSLLYELALQIQKYDSNSEINWVETFLHIEIIRLGKQYVDENYKYEPHPNLKIIKVPGYTHISELAEKAAMLIKYIKGIEKEIIEQTRDKVIIKLEEYKIF